VKRCQGALRVPPAFFFILLILFILEGHVRGGERDMSDLERWKRIRKDG